jgi:hypothetical protein
MQLKQMAYENHDCTFMSYRALRDVIFNSAYEQRKFDTRVSLPKFLKKQAAPEVTVENLKEDPNTLILIQNNTNIINLIINCKGQKDVLSFIFVENPEYINIVIKNPNGFPLLLVKIPVDNIYAFSRRQNCCYDFPIKSLLSSKESKYIKNCSYNIIYRKSTNDQGLSSVQFVYELYNKDNTNNTSFKQNNVAQQ